MPTASNSCTDVAMQRQAPPSSSATCAQSHRPASLSRLSAAPVNSGVAEVGLGFRVCQPKCRVDSDLERRGMQVWVTLQRRMLQAGLMCQNRMRLLFCCRCG